MSCRTGQRQSVKRSRLQVTTDDLCEITFAVVPREIPKSDDEKEKARAKRVNRKRGIAEVAQPVVEFECLPGDWLWDSLPRPECLPFTHPIEIQNPNRKRTSILPFVRLAINMDGLFLTHEDSRRLCLKSKNCEAVVVKGVSYLRHSKDTEVKLRVPTVGGLCYTFPGDKVYTAVNRKIRRPRDKLNDALPENSILGIKYGLQHHAVLFRRGLVYIVRKGDYVAKVEPYLFREPLRQIRDTPELEVASCIVCKAGEVIPEVKRRLLRRRIREHKAHDKENCGVLKHGTELRDVVLKQCSLCAAMGAPNQVTALLCSARCQKFHWDKVHKKAHAIKWKEDEKENEEEDEAEPADDGTLNLLLIIVKRIYPFLVVGIGILSLVALAAAGFAFFVTNNLAIVIPVILVIVAIAVTVLIFNLEMFFEFPQVEEEEPACKCVKPMICPKCTPLFFWKGIRINPRM